MEKGRFRGCVAYSNFLNLPLLRSISPDSQGNSNRFQVLHLQTHWQQFGQREMDFSAHLWAKAKSEDLTDSTVTKRTDCLGCSDIPDVLTLSLTQHCIFSIKPISDSFILMIPSWGVRTMRWSQTCSSRFILPNRRGKQEDRVTRLTDLMGNKMNLHTSTLRTRLDMSLCWHTRQHRAVALIFSPPGPQIHKQKIVNIEQTSVPEGWSKIATGNSYCYYFIMN